MTKDISNSNFFFLKGLKCILKNDGVIFFTRWIGQTRPDVIKLFLS